MTGRESLDDHTRQPTETGSESASAQEPGKAARRYDIDWLRVILFLLLIWYHYLYFAPPRRQFDDTIVLLSFAHRVMHQWRLAALFAISGMGTAFAFKRRTWQTYLKERATRLLVPLLFVVYIVNGGIRRPYTTRRLLIPLPPPEVTVHVWFVYNLLVYSVVLTPLFVHARKHPQGRLVRTVRTLLNVRHGLGVMLVPPLILTLLGILSKPWVVGVHGNGWEFPWFFLFFAFGYLLLMDRDAYLLLLDKIRAPVTGITPILAILFFFNRALFGLPGLMVGGWALEGHPAFSLAATLGTLLQAFHAWFWCLLLFSWASKLLNRPGCALTYLNQAVYPAYIVHQPLAYLTVALLGGLGFDHSLVHYVLGPLLVMLGCALVFEIVKRTGLTRVAFGIKPPPQQHEIAIGRGSRTARTVVTIGLTLLIILLLNFGTWAYWVTSQ